MQRTTFGRYELVRKIAAGGMAEIFLARQWGEAGFFRDVVIKRLFAHLAENEHALRMFQDEARLLAELSHPNIPQVFELGASHGHWYMAMEHVSGFSVADLCRAASRAHEPMPLAVAFGLVLQVCEALHHAHERCDREGRPLRIVHRDVTPQNIMLTHDGALKIMDFGVAQTSARADTDAGAVRGTYAYMAPEQVRGLPLDKRADVFAVGVILYELTTGRRLFRGNDVETMTAIVEKDVEPPSQWVAGYPPDLERIVLDALQRDRAKRTPSMAHLAIALEKLALDQSMLIGPRVLAHFVRRVFPYERARESGMGIVQQDSDEPTPVDRVSFTPATTELDERQLVEELKRLSQRPQDPAPTDDAPEPLAIPADGTTEEILELDETLLVEDETREHGAQSAEDQLGLDSLDDEENEPRPVVLLPSPKRTPGAGEGRYMSDLQKRLEQDLERWSDDSESR